MAAIDIFMCRNDMCEWEGEIDDMHGICPHCDAVSPPNPRDSGSSVFKCPTCYRTFVAGRINLAGRRGDGYLGCAVCGAKVVLKENIYHICIRMRDYAKRAYWQVQDYNYKTPVPLTHGQIPAVLKEKGLVRSGQALQVYPDEIGCFTIWMNGDPAFRVESVNLKVGRQDRALPMPA